MTEKEQAEVDEIRKNGGDVRKAHISEATVFAHDEAILANINNIVMPGDTLWCLGDFAMGHHTEDATRWLNRINCKDVRLIRGNHDHENVCKAFDFVRDYYELKIDDLMIMMCHYPMEVWNKSHYGSWMLCGHRHFRLDQNPPDRKLLDCGVDGYCYKPWSLDEIKAYMADKGIQEHH